MAAKATIEKRENQKRHAQSDQKRGGGGKGRGKNSRGPCPQRRSIKEAEGGKEE